VSSTYSTRRAPRRRWMAIGLGLVIIAAIAVVVYFALYSGGSSGYGGGGGAGGGGGGYFMLAVGADATRRTLAWIRR
jgi:peptidoglycan/LPS O-acetylase OafA/YrhL